MKSVIIPPHNPLTHTITGQVETVWVDGQPWPAFVLRALTYDERLTACHVARRDAYPPIGDQLDAAFKARMGDASPQAEIDARITAVKVAYPKPDVPDMA